MSLDDYRVTLLLWGVNLKLSPSSTLTPAIPAGPMPVFALRCPVLALSSFQTADGCDPTNPSTPLQDLLEGLTLRRVLDQMRRAGDIMAWALVMSSGTYYLNVLCTPAQITSWYQWQDWILSTLKPEAARPQQVFLL